MMVFNSKKYLLVSANSGHFQVITILLLNTTINPYYHSCVFMIDIYLTISLSTHNGDDTPQKCIVLPCTLEL